MIAIDTNILVRVLAKDDRKQAETAAKILRSNDVFISKTVILETEWVLRYVYKFETGEILGALKKLLGLSNIFTEDFHILAEAISLSEKGLDFADALHLASGTSADKFITFDKSLVGKARKSNIDKVMLPKHIT